MLGVISCILSLILFLYTCTFPWQVYQTLMFFARVKKQGKVLWTRVRRSHTSHEGSIFFLEMSSRTFFPVSNWAAIPNMLENEAQLLNGKILTGAKLKMLISLSTCQNHTVSRHTTIAPAQMNMPVARAPKIKLFGTRVKKDGNIYWHVSMVFWRVPRMWIYIENVVWKFLFL